MSDKSPFTLVSTPAETAPVTDRPRVVIPTKRREIPQATEPAELSHVQRDEAIRDAVARVKKAAKAPVLEPAPRPARSERQGLAEAVVAAGLAAPAVRKPGSTIIPPSRKALQVTEEKPVVDPFETNRAALNAAITQRLGQAPSTPVPATEPLTPAAIRKAQLAHAEAAVALVPRQKPVANEFLFKPAEAPITKTAPVLTAAPNSERKTVLPESKNQILQSSSGNMQGWLEAEGVPLKIHTPRSNDPIEAAELKPQETALVSRNRLQFNCPACHHTISTPKKLAGRKTRCPQCAAAIRAPHPKFSRGAFNYENTLEALLHPEHFANAAASRPKLLGIPLPHAHSAMVGSAAAMLMLGGAWLLKFKPAASPADAGVTVADAAPLHPPVAEPYLDKDDGFATKAAAEKLVADFLAADGWEKKALFVRDAERVGPLMKEYYGHAHSGGTIQATRLHAAAPSYYQGEQLKQRRSTVVAELPDGQQARFVVEFLPQGICLEWESSVAYSPTSWEEILTSPADKKIPPHLLRVAASVNSREHQYYNSEFSNDREYLSVNLQDPTTGEPLGTGFIPRASEDGIRLRKFLYGSSKNNPDPVMIEVRPVQNSAKERVVAITKFVKSGFRHPENDAFASVK